MRLSPSASTLSRQKIQYSFLVPFNDLLAIFTFPVDAAKFRARIKRKCRIGNPPPVRPHAWLNHLRVLASRKARVFRLWTVPIFAHHTFVHYSLPITNKTSKQLDIISKSFFIPFTILNIHLFPLFFFFPQDSF